MNYGEIKNYDIANGVGVRVSLFVSGCTNRCENCFQKETWDFNYGKVFDEAAEMRIAEMLRLDYIHGLTILGGEPFEPENQRGLLPFLRKIRQEFPHKSIWIYSGFTYEELKDEQSRCHCEATDEILSLSDVLVDGRFDESKKDLSLKFRGSSNQRIIDLKLTAENNEVTVWNENEALQI